MWKRFLKFLKSCNCENGKYLASIMDDLAIMCDEVIESTMKTQKSNDETKTILTNFNEKKGLAKLKIFMFY